MRKRGTDTTKDLYKDTGVIVLKDEDFIISEKPRVRSSVWEKGDHGYLMAYADWCPHCRNKVEMWDDFAEEMHEAYPDERFLVTAANIETDIPALARAAGVRGIPALFRILADGSLEKKQTDWSMDDLERF